MDDPNGDRIKQDASGSVQSKCRDGQRAEPRATMLFRTDKIIADGQEFLCIIRDASATGGKLQIFYPIPKATSLYLALDTDHRYPICLVWSEGEYAGFRFLVKTHLHRIIQNTNSKFPKRQIRLRTLQKGTAKWGNEVVDIVFKNISQQGAQIECESFLPIDQLVQINTPVLPQFYAKVRWRQQPNYGLIFEQTFRFRELAQRFAGV